MGGEDWLNVNRPSKNTKSDVLSILRGRQAPRFESRRITVRLHIMARRSWPQSMRNAALLGLMQPNLETGARWTGRCTLFGLAAGNFGEIGLFVCNLLAFARWGSVGRSPAFPFFYSVQYSMERKSTKRRLNRKCWSAETTFLIYGKLFTYTTVNLNHIRPFSNCWGGGGGGGKEGCMALHKLDFQRLPSYGILLQRFLWNLPGIFIISIKTDNRNFIQKYWKKFLTVDFLWKM